jgi:hypothetical protein
MPLHEKPLSRFFEMLYFSVLGFTNFGYDRILPQSATAKFLIALELIMSFITIIFMLSDFISLKESLANSRKSKSK